MTKFWINISHDDMYTFMSDTFSMFLQEGFQQTIKEHFKKPAANIRAIHDEFIRLNNLYYIPIKEKKIFDYTRGDLETVMEYEELSYRLPQTVKELMSWASILQNCMASYTGRIHKRQSIIYGVFDLMDNELLYAVEINNGRLNEVKAFGNRSLSKKEMIKIEDWFEKAYK